MRLSATEKTVVSAMVRAKFVSDWADRQEERGKTYPGQELMDVAPRTPRYAFERALMFAGQLPNLHVVLNEAAWADTLKDYNLLPSTVPYRWERPDLEEAAEALKTDRYISDLGHCLAMQALGHGVSWFDDHAKFDIGIPHFEFYLD